MSGLAWLLALLCLSGAVWGAVRMHRRIGERRELEAARAASLLAEAMHRAKAGEPALSLQLYARLIARFPQSTLLGQARTAVEAQKKKLSIPRAPGPSVPG